MSHAQVTLDPDDREKPPREGRGTIRASVLLLLQQETAREQFEPNLSHYSV